MIRRWQKHWVTFMFAIGLVIHTPELYKASKTFVFADYINLGFGALLIGFILRMHYKTLKGGA